ncbi:MAG TPA: superinfection exclusion B family protein [Candidatus Avacidaminococcus intestinavium]|uniref:Superinfection exclusion B family protein n=1 Tax=Candidatus Avacidaminococcus intestinavium TaxID=2840684 RepID=A0A9D1MNZ7_9FIRM|nr:superinfection exclusion B family protein [Candidatus Avacidaminococcus intestinavium]
MEWFSKLISALKIPLQILLPALWLFSGVMTLLNEDVLIRLSLLEWKTQNGFVFGLIFAITSCLITVYFLYFIKEKLSNSIFKLTLKRKTIKRIFEMNDSELSIILMLYNFPGYSGTLDYNEPIIQGLISTEFYL